MNSTVLLASLSLFLFVLLFVAFFKPRNGLFLLLLSRPIIDHVDPLRTSSIPGLGINYLRFLGIFLPIFLLFVLFLKKIDGAKSNVDFFENPISNYYLIYVLTCIPAVLLADQTFLMAGDFLRLLTLWVIFIYSLNVLKTKEDIQKAIFIIILSSFYPLVNFFIDLITNNYVLLNGRLRNLGGYHQQGMASLTLMTFVPAYLIYIFKESLTTKKRLFYISLLCFLLFFIYTTYFRTILLSLAVLLLYFAYFRRYYTLLAWFVSFALIAIIVSPFIWQTIVLESFSVLLNLDELFNPFPTAYDRLLSGRFEIWRKLLNVYINHSTITNIFFGFGFELPVRGIDASIAHNQLIQIMNRFGTISAIFFHIFLIKTIFFCLKKNKDIISNAVFAYVLSLIISTLAGGIFNDIRVVWFFGPYLAILINYSALKNINSENHTGG